MRNLPMLLQNTSAYRGPYIPTDGVRGKVFAKGLSPEDRIVIVGVKPDKTHVELGVFEAQVESVIFDPKQFAFVRAFRERCSGDAVDVWVE
jgi:hypothetical protein